LCDLAQNFEYELKEAIERTAPSKALTLARIARTRYPRNSAESDQEPSPVAKKIDLLPGVKANEE
jgi:hypothetical protein